MSGVFTDDHHVAVATDDLALLTDFLHAGADLHGLLTSTSLESVGDTTTGEVVGGELDLDLVAGKDADVVHAHLAADVREHLMTVLQLDAEHRVRKGLGDGALEHDRIFLWLGQKRLLWDDVVDDSD